MKSRKSGRFLVLVIGALLALPLGAYAQEATIGGTVIDTTGGVLPGVTVVAVHVDTGNTYETVTDGTGRYSIPVRIGGFTVTAALPGFNTLERTGILIQVGQTVNMDLEMAVSTLQETVTVTGEAPLLDVASSDLGGNIDAQQMQELPVSGRGWTTLALLAPGNRTNAIGATPVEDSRHDNREFQLNMDGQQVTNNLGTGSQARFSRDSIAEFQFISNRFDAAQGRSSGVQVNAISKSGTNAFTGLASGYFRRDKWNAEDHVLERVQPINISQYSFTGGGPIVRDKVHFFGNYEYELAPKTSIWNTPYDHFNVTLTGDETVNLGGARIDYQITQNMRLMGKGNASVAIRPFGNGSSSRAPTNAAENKEETKAYLASLTQVLSNRAFNEIRGGFANYKHGDVPLVQWSNHWQAPFGITTGSPRIFFRGFRISGNSNHPRYREQDTYSIRDDFTFSYDAGGRHDLKVGGEYLLDDAVTNNCSRCMGRIFARRGRHGLTNADFAAMIPDYLNADTWNLDLIPGNTIQRYQIGITSTPGVWLVPHDLHKTGLWVQDDWHATDNLTLNLGLRYDLLWNAFSQQAQLEPWQSAGRPQDTNNIQPRLGFAYRADEDTVIRGGGGIYYSDIILAGLLWPAQPELIAVIQIPYDGRSDFASNPFNGPLPTFAEADATFCHNNGGARLPSGARCLSRAAPELAPPPGLDGITQKVQTSIGVQRQVGSDVSVEADYVYSHGLNEKVIYDNVNLQFSAAGEPTGDRVDPLWGNIGIYPMTAWSNYHGLQTSLRKRLSNRWQASATYTLSWYRTGDPAPLTGLQEVSVAVPNDIGNSYSLAPTDQRHRVVFNGIVDVGGGFQLSGLYFFGMGQRENIICGCEVWDDLANQAFSDRRRENGTIIPRGAFVGEQIHRVDIRLQQRLPLQRVQIDGILEMFNLFNRANYGNFELEEASRDAIGTPGQSRNIAYGPFTMQLGFRVAF